jgi:hypothetical protein
VVADFALTSMTSGGGRKFDIRGTVDVSKNLPQRALHHRNPPRPEPTEGARTSRSIQSSAVTVSNRFVSPSTWIAELVIYASAQNGPSLFGESP